MGVEDMMMTSQRPVYWMGEPIQQGDWVKVFVSGWGGFWHHGIVGAIVEGDGGYFVQMDHNQKDVGVIVSDWHDFQGDGLIQLVKHPRSIEHAEEIVSRASANVGKSYLLFAQNCEHFASYCFDGVAKSESMEALGKIGLYTAGGFAFVKLIEAFQKPNRYQ